MADLNSLGSYGTAATERDGLLDAGVTNDSQVLNTRAARLAASQKMAGSLDNTPLGTTATKINGNPLAIGPTPAAPFIQPDSGPRAANPAVSVQVESVKNPLQIAAPLPRYQQPGVAAPPAPVAGQLSTMSYGSIGTSSA